MATSQPEAPSDRSLSLPSTAFQQAAYHSTLGLDLSVPSPLHLRLPITSRLSFNDAGKITYHRDIWDAKVRCPRVWRRICSADGLLQDLIGLVPGMSLAQWVSGRLVAQGIRGVAWLGRSLLWSRPEEPVPSRLVTRRKRNADEERGLAAAGTYAKAVRETTR